MGSYTNETKSNEKSGGIKTKVQKAGVKMLEKYYGQPGKKMKIIAITGTSGKTTVAHFVHEILKAAGQKVAVLASDGEIKTRTLHKFLADAVKAGATHAVITAPAATIRANAFFGLPIEVVALTDFIPAAGNTAEADEYLLSSKTLMAMKPKVVILNSDDGYYREFSQYKGEKETFCYGSDFAAAVKIEGFKLYKKGVEAKLAILGSRATVASFLTGEPVVHYMACAATVAAALNIRAEIVVEGIANYVI